MVQNIFSGLFNFYFRVFISETSAGNRPNDSGSQGQKEIHEVTGTLFSFLLFTS